MCYLLTLKVFPLLTALLSLQRPAVGFATPSPGCQVLALSFCSALIMLQVEVC